MSPSALETPPDSLFEQASGYVLDYLTTHAPMGFWAVTRVENGRQTYLMVEDSAYGTARGGSHAWEASFCIHMAEKHRRAARDG